MEAQLLDKINLELCILRKNARQINFTNRDNIYKSLNISIL